MTRIYGTTSTVFNGRMNVRPYLEYEVADSGSTQKNIDLKVGVEAIAVDWHYPVTISLTGTQYAFIYVNNEAFYQAINTSSPSGTTIVYGSAGWTDLGEQGGTKVIPLTHSTQQVSMRAEIILSSNLGTFPAEAGSGTTTVTVSLPAKASYEVKYNANSGTGAPSSQTKWHGESLSLSTTVPARQGYAFVNWNTSADGTGTSYASGASYTGNSAVTLYAIWHKLPTISQLAVTRCDSSGNADMMGSYVSCSATWAVDSSTTGSACVFTCGSASQSVSLSGSSGTATAFMNVGARADSALTVTATVTDGGGYTGGASASNSTAYTNPSITSILCVRTDAQGNLADEGEYMLVEIGWRVAYLGSQVAPSSLVISAARSDTPTTVVATDTISTFSGTVSGNVISGTSSLIMSAGAVFGTEYDYIVTVELNDSINITAASDRLTAAFFPFDVLAGGHGIGIGKPAIQSDLLDVGYDVHSDGEVSATDGNSVVHNLTEKADQSDVDALVTGVSGVKGNAESSYRSGNVNLTPANIGAASLSHTHNSVEPVGSYGGSTHAVALKSYFDANKSTTPRNKLINMYSSAYGNGSQAMGYFLSGYDSGPYGGFFVAHYNDPKYVGIQGGTYTEWTLSKNGHTHNYMPKTTSLYYNASGTTGTVSLSASAANYNHMRIHYCDNNSRCASLDVYSPNGKYVAFMSYHLTSNSSWPIQFTLGIGYISGTSITRSGDKYVNIGSGASQGGQASIYVYRVEAWNE